MGGKVGRTSKLAAFILVGVNFAVMLVCAVLFGFALWMISSPSSLSAAIQGFGTPALKALLSPPVLTLQLGVGLAAVVIFLFFVSFMGLYGALTRSQFLLFMALLSRPVLTLQMGVGLAAVVIFLFFVSFIGLYGALTRSQFLLFMYATLILLLLLLECALLYYFSTGLLEKGLQEQDGQWTHALRLAFKCCEYNSTAFQEVGLPWSCCGAQGYPDNCTASQTQNMGCHLAIAQFLHRYTTAIYTSLAVLHIVLSSCAILRRARGNYEMS